METIADIVKRVVALQFEMDPDSIGPGTSFIEDLRADSLDIVELTMNLEDELHICIPDKDADGFKTVGDVISYIKREKA